MISSKDLVQVVQKHDYGSRQISKEEKISRLFNNEEVTITFEEDEHRFSFSRVVAVAWIFGLVLTVIGMALYAWGNVDDSVNAPQMSEKVVRYLRIRL